MCGICGLISKHSTNVTPLTKTMMISMNKRGPDGTGLLLDNRVYQYESPEKILCTSSNANTKLALGHIRLAIVGESNYIQPFKSCDGRLVMEHNGEIYNYIELRKELEKEGYSFHSQSDTEVIIAAYAHWGDECVEHFEGMFAFAIWDEEEEELFAARDRFGEKPFFYYCDGENFLFGSEMKALWAAGVPRQPNLQMLFNFLTIGYVDNPERSEETFYELIYKLPSASRLFYAPGDAEPQVFGYWSIDPEKINKKITDNEAMEQFDHLLSGSIARRLRSDVSLGTSLSGGLDSSSIVAGIQSLQTANTPLQTFTAVFPGFAKDESSFAKLVADQAGWQQSTIAVTDTDFIADWEKLCYH